MELCNGNTTKFGDNIIGSVGNNIISKNGASYNRNDTLSDSESNTNDDEIIYDKNTDLNTNVNIFRFKFTDEFTSELFKFAKIHQYDDRKSFKEAWNIWMEENETLVNMEYRRLTELGYKGDIFDKMFKSARYYFRKKSTEKKEPAKRRNYVGTQKDLLDKMDEHIKSNISSGNFKPSEGFDVFCKENVSLLKEEVAILCQSGITDPNEIKHKIKKTYKNRYFLAISVMPNEKNTK